MLIKWAAGGAILGAIVGLFNGDSMMVMGVFGGIIAVALRKWIFRSFWM